LYHQLHLHNLVAVPCCVLQAAQAVEGSSTSSSEDELADAQVAVEEATSSGRIKEGSSGTLGSIFEVATLIFLAEWGDRSMLATIALGAAQVCVAWG
jgi:putative Ca2+/H+ antiporter (TMEM165/GDT1 family)